jgi:hypothetical protein
MDELTVTEDQLDEFFKIDHRDSFDRNYEAAKRRVNQPQRVVKSYVLDNVNYGIETHD